MALTWTLKFQDQVSGPASKIGGAARSLGAEFDALRKAADAAERSVGKSIRTGPAKRRGRVNADSQFNFAGLGAGVRTMQAISRTLGPEAVAGISRAVDAFERFGPALASVARFGATAATALGAVAAVAAAGFVKLTGYVREAQAFRESTSFAFEKLLGSKQEAAKALQVANRIAFDTGQDLRETMTGLNSLLAQGFDVKFADQLMRAMADLRVLNPQANMSGIIRAISQIKSTGRLQGDELMQLAEAGLNIDKVYKQIAASMGIVDKEGESATAQVRKLQEAGKISSDTAIKAIMDSLKAQTGKEFGKLSSEKADKSLEGTLKRIGVLRDELVQTMGVDWSPLVGAAQALMEAMKSPAAKEFAASVGKGIGDILKSLLDVKPEQIEAGFRAAAAGVTALADGAVGLIEFTKAMSGLASGFSSLYSAIEPVLAAFPTFGPTIDMAMEAATIAVMGPLLNIITVMSEFGTNIKAAAESLGSGIISGIVAGIEANVDAVISAVKGAAEGAIREAKGVLGIASPSKVFRGFGKNIMASQALGVRSEAPRMVSSVQSASAAAVEAGQMLARSITNTSSQSNQSVNVGAINVGNGAPNAGSIGSAVTDAFRSLFIGGA